MASQVRSGFRASVRLASHRSNDQFRAEETTSLRAKRTLELTPVKQTNDLALTELNPVAPDSVKEQPISVIRSLDLPDAKNTQIRELAYQLYEERGRADGHELDDWLEAESIISQAGRSAA